MQVSTVVPPLLLPFAPGKKCPGAPGAWYEVEVLSFTHTRHTWCCALNQNRQKSDVRVTEVAVHSNILAACTSIAGDRLNITLSFFHAVVSTSMLVGAGVLHVYK